MWTIRHITQPKRGLAALTLAGPNATLIADDIASTEGTAFLDIFLILGFIDAIYLVEKLERVRMHVIGFTMMAIGLVLLGYTSGLPEGKGLDEISGRAASALHARPSPP